MQKTKIIQALFLCFCLFTLTGILLIDIARALPSIGMIGLFILSIVYLIIQKEFKINKLKAYGSLMFCFGMLLPSYFYSDNTAYFLERLQINLPFLILPMCWVILPDLNLKQITICFAWFVFGVFLMALQSFVYYLFNQETVNELYLHSQVMPTLLTHHPTFSLMSAFAAYIAWQLFKEKTTLFGSEFEKYFWLIICVFLFVFTHIFSVRIGIIVLYALLILESLRFGILKGNLKVLFIFALFIFSGALVLYNSPTFKNKLINTSQDIAVITENSSANNQSLASRLISYKNAIEICNESSWLFGCGLGDIQDLNTKKFKELFPDVSKPIIPHNQFLYLLAATGLTGVLLFTFAFIYPIWRFRKKVNSILIGIYVVLLLSFQVEPVLQTQLGVAFSAFFLLMGIMLSLGQKKFNEAALIN